MKESIYLDYNATTPIDPEVADEMFPFITTRFGNPSSAYDLGRINKKAILHAREQVADLINAFPEEVIFTSGGTESNNHAIRGIVLINKEKGKHIITTSIEHPAVTEVCRHLLTLGWEITWLPVDHSGRVNPEDVEKAVRYDTVMISIMHANNEVGTIQPIEEIAGIARKYSIPFHTDAAQTPGKIQVDVRKLGVDLLTIAGHKIYGPKGIGALYIKKGTKLENLMFGAGQENGFRPGTENVSHIVGLGKACEIAKRDFDKNVQNMAAMKKRLLEGLKKNLGENAQPNIQKADTLPNTLSIAFEDIESHALVSVLRGELMISAGSACHADSVEISSVLKAMKIKTSAAAGTVRISTGKFTTGQKIDRAVELITEAVLISRNK